MISWFVPWAVVAVIIGIGVWVAVDALSGGAANSPKPASAVGSGPSSPSRSPSPQERPSPTHSPTPNPSPKRSKVPLITDGLTVQVLDGTSDATAGETLAQRLARLGFKIVAIETSSVDYSRTTVFWAYPSAKRAAKALAAHFGWKAAPKPDNLSPKVALHVVVGADAL